MDSSNWQYAIGSVTGGMGILLIAVGAGLAIFPLVKRQTLKIPFELSFHSPKKTRAKAAGWFEAALQDRLSDEYVQSWEKKLERAGKTRREVFSFLRRRIYLTCIAAVVAGIFVSNGLPWFLAFTFPGLIFFSLTVSVKRDAGKRQREIILALPYYLDLLTLALEAGLDLIAAIEEIVERDSPNALREELMITLNSIRVGTTRSQAFYDLANRTGVEPLQMLASNVTQAEELGSSMGSLLRLQSEALRTQLFSDAEEAAQKAPLKMLAPLVGFIFPVVFVLLFGPIAIRLLSM